MAAKGEINPEGLPLMKRSPVQYTIRVQEQTVVWQTLNDVCLDPSRWVWKQDGACFTSIQTDNDVALVKVMKFIRCNCKSLNNMRNSTLCACKKYGLKCVAVCEQCRGAICKNSEVIAVKRQCKSSTRDFFHVCELIP